uniref:T9SS type A sorting domain-containing protein n=1 Tax=Flexithrix dorotheae TaxID=70993 RepID=UPI0005C6B305
NMVFAHKNARHTIIGANQTGTSRIINNILNGEPQQGNVKQANIVVTDSTNLKSLVEDKGIDVSEYGINFDFYLNQRPQGDAFDIGPMEYLKEGGEGDTRRIRFSTDQLDFGEVYLGDSSELEFTIVNLSAQPVSIDSMNIPTPFYTNWNAGIIEANQSKVIKVFFKPQDSLSCFRNLIIFSDANPFEKMITLSGKGEEMLPTGDLQKDKNRTLLVTYPNPFTEQISFELDNNFFGKVYISIIDIQGKNVKELAVNKQNLFIKKTLDLSSLRKGLYFLKINAGSNIISKKIIKT